MASKDNNGYRAEIASNSLAVESGDFVSLSSGYIAKSTAGSTIEGVSVTQKTFDSDNQTVDADVCVYKPADAGEEYRVEVESGVTLQFDGDLVTSNTIDLNVNGTAMTQVTFATDNATTLWLIATQLTTDFPTLIASATAVGGDDAVKITPQPGVTIAMTGITVAAGAWQANGSQTNNVSQAKVGGYYDITSAQLVDGYTYSASSGQLQVTKYESQTSVRVKIVNA